MVLLIRIEFEFTLLPYTTYCSILFQFEIFVSQNLFNALIGSVQWIG